jgi:outer membrane protein assembly factor BamA
VSSLARVKIYGSVTLSNGAIVRATSNFHNKEWFSEVAISMSSEESNDYISDQGVCYEQVIYMFKIIY